MPKLGLAESISILVAPEAALPPSNVQPTSGWQQIEPDPGGVVGFSAKIKTIARSPLSQNRQLEAGDIVDLDATPVITGDFNKEIVDAFAASAFVATEKFCGGTGTGKFRPTAVTASQFTVPSGGALAAGILVFARGFANAANNGLFVVQAASTGTAIKTTGTVAEASPPANAIVEVVGFQFATTDLVVASATSITCTAANFTTFGLTQYQWVWIGGGTAAAPGALGFATAADRGFVQLTNIAATALTIATGTATWSADAGTGKTIQMFFGSFLRDVANGATDYAELSLAMELAMPGIGAGNVTDYMYLAGGYVDQIDINAGSETLIKMTVTMLGTDLGAPTITRATGGNSAFAPLAVTPMNTVGEIIKAQLFNPATSGAVSVDVDTWKLLKKNNIKGQKQQGKLGPNRIIVGKSEITVDVSAFVTQDDMIAAIRNNTTLSFLTAMRNSDYGVLLHCPGGKLSKGDLTFPANDAIMIAETFTAHRDLVQNFSLGMSKFPFLPAS